MKIRFINYGLGRPLLPLSVPDDKDEEKGPGPLAIVFVIAIVIIAILTYNLVY